MFWRIGTVARIGSMTLLCTPESFSLGILFLSLQSLFRSSYLAILSSLSLSTTLSQIKSMDRNCQNLQIIPSLTMQTINQSSDDHSNQLTDKIDDDSYQPCYSRLMPMKFARVLIVRNLSWEDFKGKVDANSPWSAHIYWNIDYKLSNDPKPKLSVSVKVSPKSWVRPEFKSPHLLSHQQGHLLIGYLCALQFLRRVHRSKVYPIYNEYVGNVFQKTLKEYQKMQRNYDEATEHRLDYQKQEEWNQFIQERLLFYRSIFNDKKENLTKEINN